MEYKYIQFPLCLMQETYKHKTDGLDLMSGYGIVHFALSQKHSREDVARQVVYDYYRNCDQLPGIVRNIIIEAEAEDQFTHDDDYNGFNCDGKFDATDNINELLKIFESQPDARAEAIEFYRVHQAGEFLNVKINSFKHTLDRHRKAKGIQEMFEAEYGPDAMASVKPSLLFKYRDDPKQDIDLLRAYLGAISMIGYRNFISTNKPAILSRMIGCKSKKAFEKISQRPEIQETVQKYGKRYNMDKLLLSLAEQKFIMFLSKKQTSVIYVSRYMEPQALAEMVRQSRNKYNLKKQIKDATASL